MFENFRTKTLSAVTIALIAIFTCVGVAASAYDDDNSANAVINAVPTPTPDEDAGATPTPDEDEDATPSPTPYENPSDPTPTPDEPIIPTDPMPTPSPTM